MASGHDTQCLFMAIDTDRCKGNKSFKGEVPCKKYCSLPNHVGINFRKLSFDKVGSHRPPIRDIGEGIPEVDFKFRMVRITTVSCIVFMSAPRELLCQQELNSASLFPWCGPVLQKQGSR